MTGKDDMLKEGRKSYERNPYIFVTLSTEEKEKLREISEKTGLSMRGFIRTAINGWIPSSRPSEAFLEAMEGFYRVSNELYMLCLEKEISRELKEAIDRFRSYRLLMEKEYYTMT